MLELELRDVGALVHSSQDMQTLVQRLQRAASITMTVKEYIYAPTMYVAAFPIEHQELHTGDDDQLPPAQLWGPTLTSLARYAHQFTAQEVYDMLSAVLLFPDGTRVPISNALYETFYSVKLLVLAEADLRMDEC